MFLGESIRVVPRRLRGWDPALAALIAVALVTISSHVSLIWHHAVPDFDTDTFIARANAGCGGGEWIVKKMGDTAHPLGNALIQRWDCNFSESDLLTPAHAWFLLLSVAVVAMTALVVAVAYSTGGGAIAAAVAVAYLGASPVMRTMSTRAEEQWIAATLFLITTLCILSFHRSPVRPHAWLFAVMVSSVVLDVWHTQYLIILFIGLVPWGVLALVRPGAVGTTRLRALILVGAVFLPPGAVVGFLLWRGYVADVSYQKMFFSIFNDQYWHGTLAWCRDYVTYSSRWLTGWLGNDGTQEKLFSAPRGVGFVLLGVAGLSVVLILVAVTRNSLLFAICIGCLSLPFLYEPHNAERWDAVSVIITLALASGAVVRDRPRQISQSDASAPRPPEKSGAQPRVSGKRVLPS